MHSPIARWTARRRFRRHCPHSRLVAIIGDEILRTRACWRLRCRDCGQFVDGPPALADTRGRAEGALMTAARRLGR
ncbi:hypothetical protein NONO_c60650 [Nocardia nova SH22a]|uniref:Uncharacterized protein n=1 Tax=Nocardia nova SH22a TaxID=1415166 RepID=W5TUG7_9NOCA|nr:hypothetical protein NONO_c60650 [Nocardia nova SH22a]